MQVLCRESSKHFDWLSEEAMDRMNLCEANPNLKLVFVSMCHSEAVAQKFVNMGIPHVIAVANAEKVKDRTAISFTEIFYNSFLSNGLTVQAAFKTAVEYIDIQGIPKCL